MESSSSMELSSLSRDDYLSRVLRVKHSISQLTSHIHSIEKIHRRMILSPQVDTSSLGLEPAMEQIRTTKDLIENETKFLEDDAKRDPGALFKTKQAVYLRSQFRQQSNALLKEQARYSHECNKTRKRQWNVVDQEGTDANLWAPDSEPSMQGVFSHALLTNRRGESESVYNATRARHDDIQHIERSVGELAVLYQELNHHVVSQEQQVTDVEEQTSHVNQEMSCTNTQLHKSINSARRARKLKWWTLGIVMVVLAVVGLIIGVYFGYLAEQKSKNKE